MVDSGHISVLAQEAVAGLNPKPGGIYVDATFGAGGHTRAILAASPEIKLLALDRDPEAVQRGRQLAEHHDPSRLTIQHAPFGELKQILAQWENRPVDGILFDLGVSSHQLDQPDRGFSFRFDGPLDMRMDHSRTSRSQTAADLVNHLSEQALIDLFFRFGEEPHARRMARAIVQDREKRPFSTTTQLAGLAQRVLPSRKRGIHVATKIFQALRIAVNDELDQLQQGLEAALAALAVGGRLVVISFHSLEDRMVKQIFRRESTPPRQEGPARLLPEVIPPPPAFRLITRKPVQPSEQEQHDNPRSRSAKMRILERVAPNPPKEKSS